MLYKDISEGDFVTHYVVYRKMRVDYIREKEKSHYRGANISIAYCSWEQDEKSMNDVFNIECLNPA